MKELVGYQGLHFLLLAWATPCYFFFCYKIAAIEVRGNFWVEQRLQDIVDSCGNRIWAYIIGLTLYLSPLAKMNGPVYVKILDRKYV